MTTYDEINGTLTDGQPDTRLPQSSPARSSLSHIRPRFHNSPPNEPTTTFTTTAITTHKRHTTPKSSPTFKVSPTDPMLGQQLKENAALAIGGSVSSKKVPTSPQQQNVRRHRALSRARREQEARQAFENTVRRYYYQLTVGCTNTQCTNKLCVSCKLSLKFSPEAAAIMALQLASRPRQFFCSGCPVDPPIALPESIVTKIPTNQNTLTSPSLPLTSSVDSDSSSTLTSSTSEQPNAKPFLYALFSSSPFSTIFTSTHDKYGDESGESATTRSSAARRNHKKNRRHHLRSDFYDLPSPQSPMTPTTPTISTNPLQRHHSHHHISNSTVPTSPTTPTRTGAPLRRSGSLKRKTSSGNVPSAPSTPTRQNSKDSSPAARPAGVAPQSHQSQQQQSDGSVIQDGVIGNDDNHASITAEPNSVTTDSFEYYTPVPGWKMRNFLDFNGLMSAAGMHLAYGSKKLPPIIPINHTTGNGNEGQDKGQTDGVHDQGASEVGSDHLLSQDRKKRSKSKRQKSSRKSRNHKTEQPSTTHDDKSLTNGACDLVNGALDEQRRKRRTSDASCSSSSSSGEESEAGDTETITSRSSTRSLWEEDRDDASDLTIGMTLEMLEKAIEAYRTADSNTEQNDPRLLVSMICRVFAEWEVLGNSFTVTSASPDDETPTGVSLVVDFPSLRTAYALLLSLEPRDMFTSALVNAMELLLAKMEMNVDGVFPSDYYSDGIEDDEVDGDAKWRIAQEWCRAMMCILECPLVCGFDKEESSVDLRRGIDEGLMRKVVGVLYKIGSRKGSFLRKLVVEKFSRYDTAGMTRIVQAFHSYLNDHFHVGPFKQGEEDAVVRVVSVLEFLYDANEATGGNHIIPPDLFYSEVVCKKLNIKDEYRVWKSMLSTADSGILSSSSQRDGTMSWSDSRRRRSKRPLVLSAATPALVIPYGLYYESDFQFSFLSYSFLFTPSTKARIMHVDAMSQMSAEYEDACVNHTLVMHAQRLLSDSPRMVHSLETHLRSATCPYLLLEVGRERIVDDTVDQISRKWGDLKKPLKVKFVGSGEEGMDQGGVQKEFFAEVMERMMSDAWGMFVSDEETRVIWLRGGYLEEEGTPERLREEATVGRQYEMAGVIMGLAIYNGVILGVQFPKILWKVLTMATEQELEKASVDGMDVEDGFSSLFSLEDLEEGWPALGKGLRQLLEWKEEDGDITDVFCRNFEISYEIFGKGIVNIPLCEGGSEIPVTNANRHEYVRQYCRHFMYLWVKDRLLAFRRGVWAVVGGMAVRMCRPEELEMVVCGVRYGDEETDLNMAELEEAAGYDDGYESGHHLIRDFWSIVHGMTIAQKRKLLMFVTASDRIPIGGLKDITFIVQRNGPDSERLPTALTCFSRLLLPEYSNKEKLRERLVTAIENAKGFGLV